MSTLNRAALRRARAGELVERVRDTLAVADAEGRRELTADEARRARRWLDEAEELARDERLDRID